MQHFLLVFYPIKIMFYIFLYLQVVCVLLMIAVGFSIVLAFLYRLSVIMNYEFQKRLMFLIVFLIYCVVMIPIVGFFIYAMLYDPPAVEKELEVLFFNISE